MSLTTHSGHFLAIDFTIKGDKRSMYGTITNGTSEWFSLPEPHQEKKMRFVVSATIGISKSISTYTIYSYSIERDYEQVLSGFDYELTVQQDASRVCSYKDKLFGWFEQVNINMYEESPLTFRFKMSKKQVVKKSQVDALPVAGRMADMLLTGEQSSFKIEVDKKPILVAVALVKEMSPVFAAMLESKMQESVNNAVVIDDASYEVMFAFCKFMYTGDVVISDMQMAFDLIYVGDKYQVLQLVDVAAEYAVHHLNVQNCLQAAIVAGRHDVDGLMFVCVPFILANKAEVEAHEQYEEFLNTASVTKKFTNYVIQH